MQPVEYPLRATRVPVRSRNEWKVVDPRLHACCGSSKRLWFLMPTIKGVPGPYRLFFYGFDCNEPMHVHVERERMACEFWMNPIGLADNDGFNARDLNRIRAVVQEYQARIAQVWNEHCSKS